MTDRDQSGSAPVETFRGHAIRATSIIGVASLLNISLGLIRMKIAAIVLGPVGIGMLGLLQNLLNVGATASGLNLGVAGARQIVASESLDGAIAAATARRAVFQTTCVLTVSSGLLFWLFREPLAGLVFQDQRRGAEVGWLAFGVAATAAAGYQSAIFNAGRRVRDIARLSVLSAAASALIGSICVIVWKANGILPFILAAPFATLAFGWIFIRRLPPARSRVPLAGVKPHIISLIGLGIAPTISVFATLCGQLAIRTLVERRLGATALGHFQAAWTITTVYLFFIFQSMASEYLPRLTAAVGDREKAQQLVEGQTEVGILLAAPILLVMIGTAPWVLAVLYTREFIEAAALLRYQMFGDLLRLAIWPITLVLLAGGASRAYTIVEIIATSILVGVTTILLPSVGLAAPGVAYIVMNLGYGALIMVLASRRYGVILGGHVARKFALLAICCAIVFAISLKFVLAGAIASAILAVLWAWFGFYHLQLGLIFRPEKQSANS